MAFDGAEPHLRVSQHMDQVPDHEPAHPYEFRTTNGAPLPQAALPQTSLPDHQRSSPLAKCTPAHEREQPSGCGGTRTISLWPFFVPWYPSLLLVPNAYISVVFAPILWFIARSLSESPVSNLRAKYIVVVALSCCAAVFMMLFSVSSFTPASALERNT